MEFEIVEHLVTSDIKFKQLSNGDAFRRQIGNDYFIKITNSAAFNIKTNDLEPVHSNFQIIPMKIKLSLSDYTRGDLIPVKEL